MSFILRKSWLCALETRLSAVPARVSSWHDVGVVSSDDVQRYVFFNHLTAFWAYKIMVSDGKKNNFVKLDVTLSY